MSEDIIFLGGIGIWCEWAYIVQINYKVNTVVRIGNDVVICNTDVCFLDSQVFYQLFFISPGFFMYRM